MEENIFRETYSYCDKFLNCYESNKELEHLIKQAKEFITKPLPDFDGYDLYQCQYILDDYRKDILDALDNNDLITFELIAGTIIKDVIFYFGRIKKEQQKNRSNKGGENHAKAQLNAEKPNELINSIILRIQRKFT